MLSIAWIHCTLTINIYFSSGTRMMYHNHLTTIHNHMTERIILFLDITTRVERMNHYNGLVWYQGMSHAPKLKYWLMRNRRIVIYLLYLNTGMDSKIRIQSQISSSCMIRIFNISDSLLVFNCLITRNVINGACDILWYDTRCATSRGVKCDA